MNHFWHYIQLLFAIALACFVSWLVQFTDPKPEKTLSYFCMFALTVISMGSAGVIAYNALQKITKK